MFVMHHPTRIKEKDVSVHLLCSFWIWRWWLPILWLHLGLQVLPVHSWLIMRHHDVQEVQNAVCVFQHIMSDFQMELFLLRSLQLWHLFSDTVHSQILTSKSVNWKKLLITSLFAVLGWWYNCMTIWPMTELIQHFESLPKSMHWPADVIEVIVPPLTSYDATDIVKSVLNFPK